MAEEIKFRLRKSKDGKLYQVLRMDGTSRPHFLSIDKFDLPVPVEAIRYGAKGTHRSGAFIFTGYWRKFVSILDVEIARRGDASEEEVGESDERVKDFFAMAAPVRVEDASRALAIHRRNKAEASAAPAPEKTAAKVAAKS
jgi:hypothetical protein